MVLTIGHSNDTEGEAGYRVAIPVNVTVTSHHLERGGKGQRSGVRACRGPWTGGPRGQTGRSRAPVRPAWDRVTGRARARPGMAGCGWGARDRCPPRGGEDRWDGGGARGCCRGRRQESEGYRAPGRRAGRMGSVSIKYIRCTNVVSSSQAPVRGARARVTPGDRRCRHGGARPPWARLPPGYVDVVRALGRRRGPAATGVPGADVVGRVRGGQVVGCHRRPRGIPGADPGSPTASPPRPWRPAGARRLPGERRRLGRVEA